MRDMSSSESRHTPKPWKLIWWGNEKDPYPFDVETEDGASWITRAGTVSSKAYGILMAAAPEMYEALRDTADYLIATHGPIDEAAASDLERWDDKEAGRVYRDTCAAIAKAEGGAS